MIALDYKKVDELLERYKGYLIFPNNENMSADGISHLIQWKAKCDVLQEILGNTDFRTDALDFYEEKIQLVLTYFCKWSERDGSLILTENNVNLIMEILSLKYQDKGKLNSLRGHK